MSRIQRNLTGVSNEIQWNWTVQQKKNKKIAISDFGSKGMLYLNVAKKKNEGAD